MSSIFSSKGWVVGATTLAAALLAASIAYSANPFNITFPIPELGNCGSMADCKVYCDDSANADACQSFAESHGLAPKKDSHDQKIQDILKDGGPGGCTTKDACKTYCSAIDHADECIKFAAAHNLIPPDQAQKFQTLAEKIKDKRSGPGGCKTEDKCRTYCSDAAHIDECVKFGEDNGIISHDDAIRAQKILPILQSGGGPGGCKTPLECKQYCSLASHKDECIAFGKKAGIITDEEAANFQNNFGKGPGGCDSVEACATYCNQPENKNACISFAAEHGLISNDDIRTIHETQDVIQQKLPQVSSETIQCLKDNVGDEIIQQIQSGNFIPGIDTGEKVRECFEQFMHPQGTPWDQPQVNDRNGPDNSGNAATAAPASADSCIQQILGGDALDQFHKGILRFTIEAKQRVLTCMQGAGKSVLRPMPPQFAPPARLQDGQDDHRENGNGNFNQDENQYNQDGDQYNQDENQYNQNDHQQNDNQGNYQDQNSNVSSSLSSQPSPPPPPPPSPSTSGSPNPAQSPLPSPATGTAPSLYSR